MKKIIASLSLLILLAACSSPKGEESYEGSDFSFSYPSGYELRRAATTFLFEDQNGDIALTMIRYLADSPEEVVEQMNSVGKKCDFKKGGKNYGGYKTYSIVASGSVEGDDPNEICDLQGYAVDGKGGIFMLFVENDPSAKMLQNSLKSSFVFTKN